MYFKIFRLKRLALTIFCSFCICILILFVTLLKSCDNAVKNADTFDKRCIIAEGYGYDISDCEQKSAHIDLGSMSDEIFDDYNSLQLETGFDLRGLRRETIIRYSYVLNDGSELGLLTYNGNLVGGDLFSVIDGGYLPIRNNNGD